MHVLLFPRARCTAYCSEDQAGFSDSSLAVQFLITGLYIGLIYASGDTMVRVEDALAVTVSIQVLLLWMKLGYFARC